jgi:hypothetical protein
MSLLHVGVDPGLSGAIAILDADSNVVLLSDLPVSRDKSLAWIDGGELQSLVLRALQGRRAVATIERVSSRPAQGIASAFQFGLGYGSVLSVLQALHISLSFVTPAGWKKFYGLGADKKAALFKARLSYPTAELHLVKHSDRAEALLIAEYGRRTFHVEAAA